MAFVVACSVHGIPLYSTQTLFIKLSDLLGLLANDIGYSANLVRYFSLSRGLLKVSSYIYTVIYLNDKYTAGF